MSRDRVLVATLALLLVAYVGGYLGLSNPSRAGVGRGGGYTSWVEPNYRVGGDAAERVFWPLEQLDRRMRPDFWATRSYDYNTEADVAPTPPVRGG